MVRCVRRAVDLPIVVDLDSGYGDPVKVHHVVADMIRAGASALCIEDNLTPKRCSLYAGYDRHLVSIDEHIARLRAARVAVAETRSQCRIIARTEAFVAGLGLAEALRRATAYTDAGANAVFIQSLDATGKEVLTFGRKWQSRVPLFIAPTRLPQITKKEFFAAGISHTIFANQSLRAAHAALDRTFRALAEAQSAQVVESEISTISAVGSLVGADKVVALEKLVGQHNVEPVLPRDKKPAGPSSPVSSVSAAKTGGNRAKQPIWTR